MAVTDADGIIYYRYIYDTYGELSDITTDDGVSLKSSEQLTEYRLAELAHATGIDYLYNGQYGVETDQNGLYYMRARYYNQDIKRFINRDVVSGDISNSQSLNRYCYLQGNPVSLTDPFGLCPDPNSNFKNFCKFLYYTDWSAIGHAALDVAGLFWDGADVINALWYALERNPEMAIASAIFAIPGAGIGIGNFMMKSEKLASAGKAVRAVSKFTQSAIGVGAGMSIATVGYQNLRHSIEAGEFSLTDLATFIGGLTIAAISGKGLISSGKDLMACSDDLAKMWKKTKNRVSENFRKFMNDNGGFLDVDALVGKRGSNTALTVYDPEFAVKQLLVDGKTSEDLLRSIVPQGTPNTFVPSATIKEGYKYNFSINGTNIEIKWHSQDLNAAVRYPGSNSGAGWTAQIKVGKKLLTQSGRFVRRPRNYTHIPLRGGD